MRRRLAVDAAEYVEGRDAYAREPRRLSHLWGAYRLAHAVRLHNRLAAEAARFRSKHLAPSAGALSLRLGADRDLAIQTEFPAGWWETPPAVGGARGGRARLTTSK